jgi:L-rhamnose isomerase
MRQNAGEKGCGGFAPCRVYRAAGFHDRVKDEVRCNSAGNCFTRAT